MKTLLRHTRKNVKNITDVLSKTGVEIDNQLKDNGDVLCIEYLEEKDKVILSNISDNNDTQNYEQIQILFYKIFKSKGIDVIRTSVRDNEVNRLIYEYVKQLSYCKYKSFSATVVFGIDDFNDVIFYPKFNIVNNYRSKGSLFLTCDEFVNFLSLFNAVCKLPREYIQTIYFPIKRITEYIPTHILFKGDNAFLVDKNKFDDVRYDDTHNAYNNIKRLMLLNDIQSFFLEIENSNQLETINRFVRYNELEMNEFIHSLTIHFVENKCEINNEILHKDFVYGNKFINQEKFYGLIEMFLNNR